MDLKEFIFDDKLILKLFPYIARAPPMKIFEDYATSLDDIVYSNDETVGVAYEFNQLKPETEEDFNQDVSW